jgi:anti-sigma factor ChrR (cupin superfamily)
LPDTFDDDHPEYASLMRRAWAPDLNDRPTFDVIVLAFTAAESKSAAVTNTAVTVAKPTTKPHIPDSKQDELMEPLLPLEE